MLGTEHSLLHIFLNIWCQILFLEDMHDGEVLKCDARSIRSIRSTDCSVISQGRRPVQDSFQDHQSQLDVGDVCDLFSFVIYFTICSRRRGQKEVIFAKTAQAYFSCAQDVKLYSCLHHQSSESTSAQLRVSHMGCEDEEVIELSNCNFR